MTSVHLRIGRAALIHRRGRPTGSCTRAWGNMTDSIADTRGFYRGHPRARVPTGTGLRGTCHMPQHALAIENLTPRDDVRECADRRGRCAARPRRRLPGTPIEGHRGCRRPSADRRGRAALAGAAWGRVPWARGMTAPGDGDVPTPLCSFVGRWWLCVHPRPGRTRRRPEARSAEDRPQPSRSRRPDGPKTTKSCGMTLPAASCRPSGSGKRSATFSGRPLPPTPGLISSTPRRCLRTRGAVLESAVRGEPEAPGSPTSGPDEAHLRLLRRTRSSFAVVQVQPEAGQHSCHVVLSWPGLRS